MFDDLDIKKEKINLKEALPTKFYNELAQCDFLKDLDEIVNGDSIINIDIYDIKVISASRLVGTISQCFKDLKDDYNIKLISDEEPTDCIFCITGNKEIRLAEVNNLLDKLRDIYPNLNIIFGTKIDENFNLGIKVQAILTLHTDLSFETEEPVSSDKEVSEKKEIKKLFKEYKDEKELLYDIALYCIDNNISLNNIQNEFNLGFNRASKLLESLENLRIISEKIQTSPRKILISDKNIIKEKIDNM